MERTTLEQEIFDCLMESKHKVDLCRRDLRNALDEMEENKRSIVRYLVREEQFDLLTVNMTRIKQKMSR